MNSGILLIALGLAVLGLFALSSSVAAYPQLDGTGMNGASHYSAGSPPAHLESRLNALLAKRNALLGADDSNRPPINLSALLGSHTGKAPINVSALVALHAGGGPAMPANPPMLHQFLDENRSNATPGAWNNAWRGWR